MKSKGSGGFALPILLILLSAIAAFVAVKTLHTFGSFELRASMRTDKALAQTRDALLAYAAWEDESPGALPCPDLDGDGDSDSCGGGGTVSFGRIPWKTLGIPPPRDAAGECIWYALSAGARSSAIQTTSRGRTQPAINPDYLGDLQLRDATTGISSPAIAILIAPGRALTGQARAASSTGCNGGVATDLFEARDGINNSAGGTTYITGAADDTFNDRAVAIDNARLFAAVAPRILIAWAGTGAAPDNGLRRLVNAGQPPTSFIAGETLLFPFVDGYSVNANAADAFGRGLTLTVEDGSSPSCVKAVETGNYTIEWLCYNNWQTYTHASLDEAGNLALSLRGWHLAVDPATSPRPMRDTH